MGHEFKEPLSQAASKKFVLQILKTTWILRANINCKRIAHLLNNLVCFPPAGGSLISLKAVLPRGPSGTTREHNLWTWNVEFLNDFSVVGKSIPIYKKLVNPLLSPSWG